MKPLISVFFLTICLFALSCKKGAEFQNDIEGCADTYVPVSTHAKTKELQNLLEQYTLEGIPGVSLAVESKELGNFYGVSGFASLPNEEKLLPCHTFRIASLTKTIVATAVMRLVEAGELDVDAPISSILKEETLKDLPKANDATIGKLLSHTSGIPNYDSNPRFVTRVLNNPGEEITREERIAFAKGGDGTEDWVMEKYGPAYSNTNYVLLELILENITGQRYDEYLKETLLHPMGLDGILFGTQDAYPFGLCSGYCDMYDNGHIREVSAFDANRWSAEGSAISGVENVHNFFKMLLQAELTKPSTLEEMKVNGFGLLREDFNGIEGIGHDGQAVGYSSEMWHFPEKELTITLLANRGRISDQQPSIQLFEQLFLDVIAVH